MDIPVIDFARQRNRQAADPELARDMDAALSGMGFMALANLPIAELTLRNAFIAAARFFDLPIEAKQSLAYGAADDNFGYQAIGEERLDPGGGPDFKEALTLRDLGRRCDVPWPEAGVGVALLALQREAVAAARAIQRVIASALSLEPDFFRRCHSGTSITLRLLHYPEVPATVTEPLVVAGAHSDYGTLTLLFQDGEGGLQVYDGAGRWLDIAPRRGTVTINAGDMLERWTNGRYRSTRHRVVRSPGAGQRFSIALFMDPDPETVIAPLPGCCDDSASRYPAVTAGDYLVGKLEATHGHSS